MVGLASKSKGNQNEKEERKTGKKKIVNPNDLRVMATRIKGTNGQGKISLTVICNTDQPSDWNLVFSRSKGSLLGTKFVPTIIELFPVRGDDVYPCSLHPQTLNASKGSLLTRIQNAYVSMVTLILQYTQTICHPPICSSRRK